MQSGRCLYIFLKAFLKASFQMRVAKSPLTRIVLTSSLEKDRLGERRLGPF